MNDFLFKEHAKPDDSLAHIHRLLLGHFDEQKPREPWDPLSQFIYSLLSSRTKTETTYQVVRHLRERFGTWENLRDASLAEIEDGIRDVTFPEQKAVQLKASLEGITQRYGSLTLDFLARYRTDKIRAWLEQFPGVGPKTSAAVVNFSTLRRRAMCVDSHHLRVTQRLGLTRRADAATTEERLMRMVPETWTAEMLDEHHQLIKQLGQTICTFSEPKCGRCPLLKLCPYGQKSISAAEEARLSLHGDGERVVLPGV
ncbi:endonuclease III domain-containing protein [Edaphobacter modestus]|uniref:Endonuclease-3 n=1 Tax=Edaphobacter modestus TaxID=388466 RepID=A0A4Q7YXC3_9BACT|nr:iron-sulfur cluster loop [Edaphobacter modestus]RZU41793.1 endonuclease-3 [Edaphobacter modestus]